MKIFEVIPKLQSGGAEKFVADLSSEFASMGHECTLVTLYDPAPDCILDGYVSSGVARVYLGKKPGFDFGIFRKLYRLIRKERPGVVHLHVGAIKYGLLAAFFCRYTKFFATIHSEARREAGKGVELCSRKLLFGSHKAIPVTISPESEASFERFYGFRAPMIFNGCSDYISAGQPVLTNRDGVDFLFVHAGRLQPVKNQLMLVRAFDRLVKDGYNVRLILMGRKEDCRIFDEIEPFLSDHIQYAGEQSDCRAYMAGADGFCLSSKVEAMPITLIEAFSVGCVPVVTPAGGCPSMVEDGVNGFISDGFDLESYYSALKRFVTQAERLPELKAAARETYEKKYSISSCAANYLELFESIR